MRFGQIAQDESKIVRLLRDGEPVIWTPVAKDGADLTDAQKVASSAEVRLEVGETYDIEWVPEGPGIYQLQVTTIRYPLDSPTGATQTIAIGVGGVSDAALAEAHSGYTPSPQETAEKPQRIARGPASGCPLTRVQPRNEDES